MGGLVPFLGNLVLLLEESFSHLGNKISKTGSPSNSRNVHSIYFECFPEYNDFEESNYTQKISQLHMFIILKYIYNTYI